MNAKKSEKARPAGVEPINSKNEYQNRIGGAQKEKNREEEKIGVLNIGVGVSVTRGGGNHQVEDWVEKGKEFKGQKKKGKQSVETETREQTNPSGKCWYIQKLRGNGEQGKTSKKSSWGTVGWNNR